MATGSDIRAGRAYVELLLKNSEFIKGLAKAKKTLQDFGNGVSLAGKWMMGIGTAAIGPIIAATAKFESMGSALFDMSKRTGVGVEALSELKYAAEQTGAGIEDVETAVRKMQKTIGDASTGGTAGKDALAGIGLTVEKLKDLKPEDQFALVAKGLSQIKDPTMQAAAAMEIFGKSGTGVLPMIGDLDALKKRARELGIVMGTEDAAAADVLGDAIGDLKNIIISAGNTLVARFSPMIQDAIKAIMRIVDETRKWIDHNQELVGTLVSVAAKTAIAGAGVYGIGKAFSFAGSAFGELTKAFTFIATNGVLLTAGLAAAALGIGAIAAAFVNAKSKGISFGESVLDLTNKLTGLSNAYSKWQDNMAASKAIGAPTKTFDKGLQNSDVAGMKKGIDEMQANRDRIASELKNLAPREEIYKNAIVGAVKINVGGGEDYEQKKRELAQAEMLLNRTKRIQEDAKKSIAVAAPIRAIPKILEAAKAGEQSGIDFAKRFMDAATPRLEFIGEAMRDMLKLKAENILDPQKREKALLNIEYDTKASGIQGKINQGKLDKGALSANETMRQQALANIRQKYALEAADRERQLADETAAFKVEATKQGMEKELALLKIRHQAELDEAKKKGLELKSLEERQAAEIGAAKAGAERNTADEIERLKIETTMQGVKKDLALLKLRHKKEMEDAKAGGLDIAKLAMRQGLEERAMMMQNLGSNNVRGTFSATAVEGLGMSSPLAEIARMMREEIKEFRQHRAAGRKDWNELMRRLEARP